MHPLVRIPRERALASDPARSSAAAAPPEVDEDEGLGLPFVFRNDAFDGSSPTVLFCFFTVSSSSSRSLARGPAGLLVSVLPVGPPVVNLAGLREIGHDLAAGAVVEGLALLGAPPAVSTPLIVSCALHGLPRWARSVPNENFMHSDKKLSRAAAATATGTTALLRFARAELEVSWLI